MGRRQQRPARPGGAGAGRRSRHLQYGLRGAAHRRGLQEHGPGRHLDGKLSQLRGALSGHRPAAPEHPLCRQGLYWRAVGSRPIHFQEHGRRRHLEPTQHRPSAGIGHRGARDRSLGTEHVVHGRGERQRRRRPRHPDQHRRGKRVVPRRDDNQAPRALGAGDRSPDSGDVLCGDGRGGPVQERGRGCALAARQQRLPGGHDPRAGDRSRDTDDPVRRSGFGPRQPVQERGRRPRPGPVRVG